jgi:hypothetical protein
VAPFLALGAALHAAGHQATLLAASTFHPLAESAGLAFASIPQLNAPAAAGPLLDLPAEPVALSLLYERLSPLFAPLLDAVVARLPSHDALVVSHLFPFFKNAAHAARRSFAVLVFNPDNIPFPHASPSGYLPPIWLPKFLHAAHHRRVWHARETQLDQIVQLHAGAALHAHRLGKFTGFLHAPADRALIAVSPALFPPPVAPPAPYLYTGFLRPLPPSPPAEQLAPVAALARSGAPVTVLALDGPALTQPEILPRLFAAWPPGLPLILRSDRPATIAPRPEIMFLPSAPLDELFSFATVVVHPGSAESTAAALFAGHAHILIPPRPSYWTKTLPALGVASLLDPANWPEKLPAAVDAALRTIARVRRVAECAALVHSENGPARTVAQLEKW